MAGTRSKSAAGKKKSASPKKAASAKTAVRGKQAAAAKSASRKAAATKSPGKKAAAKPVAGKKRPARKRATTRRSADQRSRGPAAGIAPYQPKRGEAYMSDGQREHFRRLLQAWKRELMEEVDRTVHHMQDEASNFPDPNDRASQESEFSLELRTRDRERKLLRKIEQALKRTEINEYGWCESCGAEIGIRRLEARPTATLCIDCKTLDEIRERQKGK